MRKLFVIQGNQTNELEIGETTSWQRFLDDGMPGILLGQLRMYREDIEKVLEIPHKYRSEGGKVNVAYEVMLSAKYLLYSLAARKEVNKLIEGEGDDFDSEKYEKGIKEMLELCYSIAADAMNCNNVVIDIDNDMIYDKGMSSAMNADTIPKPAQPQTRS